MQFQTPQFIEIEDKIFARLTFKQAIYIGGGGGMAFTCFYFIPFKIISIPIALAFAIFGLMLAFYRPNNRSFVFMLQSAFYYFTNSRLYIWKKKENVPVHTALGEGVQKTPALYIPKLSDSKLKDLTWSLDIKESLNPVTRDKKPDGRVLGGERL